MSGELVLDPTLNDDEVQFLVEIITIDDELIEEEVLVGEELPDVSFLEEIIVLHGDGKWVLLFFTKKELNDLIVFSSFLKEPFDLPEEDEIGALMMEEEVVQPDSTDRFRAILDDESLLDELWEAFFPK